MQILTSLGQVHVLKHSRFKFTFFCSFGVFPTVFTTIAFVVGSDDEESLLN